MHRRRYLRVGLAAAGAGLAGCLDRVGGGNGGGSGSSGGSGSGGGDAGTLEDWQLRSHAADGIAYEDSPTVDVEAASERVVVRGRLVVGSSTCKTVAIDTVEYDGSELSVAVHDAPVEDRPRECTDDISTDGYELEVTVDGGVPERVVATERDYYGETRRTEEEG